MLAKLASCSLATVAEHVRLSAAVKQSMFLHNRVLERQPKLSGPISDQLDKTTARGVIQLVNKSVKVEKPHL